MSEALSYSAKTTNYEMPLLYSGQAQKEVLLNQSLSIIDALIPRSVVSLLATPPIDAVEGESYLIATPSSGEWAGKEGQIALRVSGAWEYITPIEGMTVFNQALGQKTLFRSNWQTANEPTLPSGGGVIDTEARLAIADLTEALRNAGLLANSP